MSFKDFVARKQQQAAPLTGRRMTYPGAAQALRTAVRPPEQLAAPRPKRPPAPEGFERRDPPRRPDYDADYEEELQQAVLRRLENADEDALEQNWQTATRGVATRVLTPEQRRALDEIRAGTSVASSQDD